MAEENTNPEIQNSAPQKRKRRLVLKVVAISALVIAIAGVVFVKYYLTPFVKKKIISAVHTSTKGLYTLSMEDFGLRFWKGAIYMKSMHLEQDTVILNQLRQADPTSNLSAIDIKVDELLITRIWWQNFILNHSLKVGRIEINGPKFIMNGQVPKDTIRVSEESFLEVLPGLIASVAGSLNIERLTVNRGQIDIAIMGEAGVTRQSADSIFVDLKEIRIDTVSPQKELFSDDVKFSVENYNLITSDQLFKLIIGKISGSNADSTLAIDRIKFAPTGKKDGKDSYDVFINKIVTDEIDFPLFFREKKVSLGTMLIDAPDINVAYTIPPTQQGEKQAPKKNFLQTALPYIANSFQMKRFKVVGGKFNTAIGSSAGLTEQSANNLNINLEGIAVDSVTLANERYYESVELSLSDFQSKIHKDNLRINFAALRASSLTESVTLDRLTFKEVIPSTKNDGLIMTNYVDQVQMQGFKFDKLSIKDGVSMNTMNINGMKVELHNRPGAATSKKKPKMPNEMMQDIPFKLRISRVNLNNGYLLFQDYAPDMQRPGRLTFERIDLSITNLTNDPALMSNKNPAKLKLVTYMMGKGKLALDLRMNLLSKSFDLSYTGGLGKMDATYFNSFLAYAGMQLKSGTIEAQDFKVTVRNGVSNGDMLLLYENLDAAIIKKKTGKVKKVLSAIVNFVLKNENPKDNKLPEQERVPIEYSRKPDDNFVLYLWSSLNEALINTVVKKFFQPFVPDK